MQLLFHGFYWIEENETISTDNELYRIFSTLLWKEIMELRISSDLHILPSESNDPLSLFGNFPGIVNIKKRISMQVSVLGRLIPVKLLKLSKL